MNSPTQPSVDAADLVESATADGVEKAEIPAFKFPFKPGELGGAKNGHTKTPGMAPPGTRRSMGKR